MRRPSPATVIATIALFVALGGTGYAAAKLPRNSVGTPQLKTNAVTSGKVKNGTLLAADFKSGELTRPLGSSVSFTPLETCRAFDIWNADPSADPAETLKYVLFRGVFSTSGYMYCPLAGVPVGARVTSVDVVMVTADPSAYAEIVKVLSTGSLGPGTAIVVNGSAVADDTRKQTITLTPPADDPVVVGGHDAFVVGIDTPDHSTTVQRVTVTYSVAG